MEHEENPLSLPVIARLDRLDRSIMLLEERPRRDDCAVEGQNECKTLSSALEEVQHKGTLMERLAILEKRVLELSLVIDERNSTTRSSSSTVQGSEMKGKNDYELKREDENGDTINKQQIQDPSTLQAQKKASPANGVVKETTSSHRSTRQKAKCKKKWPWLF